MHRSTQASSQTHRNSIGVNPDLSSVNKSVISVHSGSCSWQTGETHPPEGLTCCVFWGDFQLTTVVQSGNLRYGSLLISSSMYTVFTFHIEKHLLKVGALMVPPHKARVRSHCKKSGYTPDKMYQVTAHAFVFIRPLFNGHWKFFKRLYFHDTSPQKHFQST